MTADKTFSPGGTGKWMTAGICVVVSVIFHVVVLMSFIYIQFFSKVIEDIEEEENAVMVELKIEALVEDLRESPEKAREMEAPMTSEELRNLVVKPRRAEKKPERKASVLKYARTSDDQLSGKVPDTDVQGERDTLAASNKASVLDAPDRPSVDGIDDKERNQELVDTRFQDGVLEHMNLGADAAKSQEEKLKREQAEESKAELSQDRLDKKAIESGIESNMDGGAAEKKALLAQQHLESAKRNMETQKKELRREREPISQNKGATDVASDEELKRLISNKKRAADAAMRKAEREMRKRRAAQKEAEKRAIAQREAARNATKKGMRSEAKAKVMQGTISRRSKIASGNVKKTPVGVYMAKISKLVEQEWQRRVMMHADLIQPGTLRIGFMVNERGKVINYRVISKVLGSENQTSITFQALTSAKIPTMPQRVRKSQGGDPLEFIYYFQFN